MIFNTLALVIVSKRGFEFDGRQSVHSVNDRETRRLIGHVGKTRNSYEARTCGTWCYLHVSDNRDSWTVGGWTLAEAVDKLMSADNPSGMFVAGVR